MPEESVDFAGGHEEREVVNDGALAELLINVFEFGSLARLGRRTRAFNGKQVFDMAVGVKIVDRLFGPRDLWNRSLSNMSGI